MGGQALRTIAISTRFASVYIIHNTPGSTAEHNREQLIPLGQGSPAGITPKRPPPPSTVVQHTDRHFGKVHRTRGHDRAFACWEIFPRIWSTPRRCGPITGGKEEGVKVSWGNPCHIGVPLVTLECLLSHGSTSCHLGMPIVTWECL